MLHKRTNTRGVKEMEEKGKERERSTDPCFLESP